MSRFSDMLLFLRKRQSLTQEELGNALGVAKSTISMYEQGSRKPSFEMLEIIADYFNINMDTLVGSSDLPKVPPSSFTLAPDERQLVDDYRSLTPPGQEYIRQTMAMAKVSYSEKNDALPNMEEAN